MNTLNDPKIMCKLGAGTHMTNGFTSELSGDYTSTLVFYLGANAYNGLQIAVAFNGSYLYIRPFWDVPRDWRKVI